nr:hypothetical protein [Tanacetum cinerariifolium]
MNHKILEATLHMLAFTSSCGTRKPTHTTRFTPLHTGASILKDPPPSDNHINAKLLALLDHLRTIISRSLKTFLCLVGLSCLFDDVLVRPTLLQDDESGGLRPPYMGLLDFVKSADPFKVKTEERTLAEGEVKEHAGRKKKRVVFLKLPAKWLKSDATSSSEATPLIDGKSPTSLRRLKLQSEPSGVGSSSIPPHVEEFVSSSVTLIPELDAYEGSGSSQDGGVRTHHASMGIVVSSSSRLDDEVAAPRVEDVAAGSARGTVDTSTADNIYVPEWGVPNGARVGNPALCRNLLDHITPPGYWATLRNLPLPTLLDGFNFNYSQHTCMFSELRLWYEHEIMTREKFQKKFTDTCAVVQQRDAKITVLRTRLEKAERKAVDVVSLCGRVSELEAGVAVKSQEVGTLGIQKVELLNKVSALESERGELKRHFIKLRGDCECLRKEAVGEAKLREEFNSFHGAEARHFEQKSAELDARIANVRRDMDNDMYPYMFTVITGRRCLLSHGVHLAVEAYNPGVKDDFGSTVTDFKNVSFGLLDELELLKDSPFASIMSVLVLKDAHKSGSMSGELLLFEVIPIAHATGERRRLRPPLLVGASGSVPHPGSSLGVSNYQVLSNDGGPATQSPIV